MNTGKWWILLIIGAKDKRLLYRSKMVYTLIGEKAFDEKGKPTVRWGRKVIGSLRKDSLATESDG